MYGWLWRRLPFGLRGKISGSLLLVAAVAALLWYVVFPAVEPMMPFNDVQIDTGGQTDAPVAPNASSAPGNPALPGAASPSGASAPRSSGTSGR